jgi:hypothetical protein
VTFQLAEVAVTRELFAAILDRIAQLALPPPLVAARASGADRVVEDTAEHGEGLPRPGVGGWKTLSIGPFPTRSAAHLGWNAGKKVNESARD